MKEDKVMKDIVLSTNEIDFVDLEKTDVSDHYFVFAKVKL